MATAPAEKTDKPEAPVPTVTDTPSEAPKAPEASPEPEPKAPEPKAPEPEEQKTKPATKIRAVYGRMVDPTTGLEFTQVPGELFKKSSWVQSQIDAGKLVLVED